MPPPDGIELRRGGPDDIPAIAALRQVVGWGVHDWALRAVTELAHATCIVAVDQRRRTVGTGSGISYGRLGVVGNMVVDPAHRRRGLGAAILEAVMAFLAARGCERLELSATALGRPLYRRFGFVPARRGLSVVVPRLPVATAAAAGLGEAGPSAAAEVRRFDTPRFGGDRGTLVARMLADADRPVLVARTAGRLAGWAWVRPDATRIGPLVADSPELAVALVGEAFRRMPSAATLRLNLPAPTEVARQRLAAAGASFEAWEGRMAFGPAIPRRDETMYASAVGALG